MKHRVWYLFLFLSPLFLFEHLTAQQQMELRRPLGDEQAVVAEIEARMGTVRLRRAPFGELFSVTEHSERGRDNTPDFEVEYTVEDNVAYVRIVLGAVNEESRHSIASLSSAGDRMWNVYISDAIPVSFTISVGAGSAMLDLTQLRVRDLDVENGAGSVSIAMETPNSEIVERAYISSGIGSMRTRKLGNLRFRSLEFSGGVGKYLLDVRGAVLDDARIMTDVGVGSLTMILPEGYAAKAVTDRNWFNRTELPRFIRQSGGNYVTPDFQRSSRRIVLGMQSGLGSTTVRWSK
jgi:hypothetical protein